MKRLLPLLALTWLSGSVLAQEAAPIQGVYSNIAMTPSEDYAGMEVILSLTDSGYYAVLQCASGADATRPVVVAVNADAGGGVLAFAAHDDPDNSCPMEPFTGTVTRDGLRVHYDDGDDRGLLPRGRSFWQ